MKEQDTSKKFIFNEKLDADYLFSLYADDYGYIEEIFGITLDNFDPDLEALKMAYESGNLADLKRAAHKIKPTLGFAGMPQVQQQCKDFEDLCQKVDTTGELKEDYKQIVITLADCKELITAEHKKLKEFNTNLL